MSHKSGIGALISMLSTRRPYRAGKAEQNFAHKWLAPLGARPDQFGNWILRRGESRVLWSSHLDTVHAVPGHQRISVNPSGLIKLARKEKTSNCLGADCTAGVWIMREMILAGVPGLYVFHSGEECGGLGSRWIEKNAPELLASADYAIAFDRRGTQSIITHQSGGRCCSEAFSDSLAKAIGLPLRSDSGGLFTDTANYVDAIGECSNVSVGYESEHSRGEVLDSKYLIELCAAMCSVFDESNLVSARKPGEYEPRTSRMWQGRLGLGTGDNGPWGDYGAAYGYGPGFHSEPARRPLLAKFTPSWQDVDGPLTDSNVSAQEASLAIDLVEQMIELNPHEVATILVRDYGMRPDSLADDLQAEGGAIPSDMLSAPMFSFGEEEEGVESC